MEDETKRKTSFSAGRRWGIFFSVLISIVAVVALVVMANYLGARYYTRLSLSAQTRTQISPQTAGLIKSITNEVKIVVYYDKKDDFYDPIMEILNEFRLKNPKISVETVDYRFDAARALVIKEKYKDYLGLAANKNLVIFDCGGRPQVIPEGLLGRYAYSQEQDAEATDASQRIMRKKIVAFQGEEAFRSALLAVTSPKPMTAYFFEGNGLHHALDAKGDQGYDKFATVLRVNYIQPVVITQLVGTNTVPSDCNLLIIAGPKKILPIELEKIRDYLNHGGRLFVLFNVLTKDTDTGLEAVLADWGVSVGKNVVKDPNNSSQPSGDDLEIHTFNPTQQLVNPLIGSELEMVLPRSIGTNDSKPGPDAPKVEELAFTEETASVVGIPATGRRIPVMVAVEKSGGKGSFPERGTTRIVVTGDSIFLNNSLIEAADNKAFAAYAINWLLDRKALLDGVGPHPVMEYKLAMTRAQLSSIRWVFLAGMPGAFLLFGGLVWLRRRH